MFTDISELLHHERGKRLASMPRTGGTLLSAGCAGLWYFDWIEEFYGAVDRHIGIEFYSPRPEGLPENVEWIENTVGDMKDVADASVDTLFSGENLEHIWPTEAIDFFCESARVLKAGGSLVIDSPNRSITKKFGWSHPEHTVEFTTLEAIRVSNLAGFDVTAINGIWLCRDPRTGKMLQFTPDDATGVLDQEQRRALGRNDPSNAFIWWMEATRSNREPDRKALAEEVQQIFRLAWPERCKRFTTHMGEKTDRGFRSPAGVEGALIYGPYMPLPAGDYEAVFNLRVGRGAGGNAGRCDVMIGDTVVARQEIKAPRRDGAMEIRLPISLDGMTFAVQARVISSGLREIDADLPTFYGAGADEILSILKTAKAEPAA